MERDLQDPEGRLDRLLVHQARPVELVIKDHKDHLDLRDQVDQLVPVVRTDNLVHLEVPDSVDHKVPRVDQVRQGHPDPQDRPAVQDQRDNRDQQDRWVRLGLRDQSERKVPLDRQELLVRLVPPDLLVLRETKAHKVRLEDPVL